MDTQGQRAEKPDGNYALSEVLELLERAISELDRMNAPPDIAAHVDMARHRVLELLD